MSYISITHQPLIDSETITATGILRDAFHSVDHILDQLDIISIAEKMGLIGLGQELNDELNQTLSNPYYD